MYRREDPDSTGISNPRAAAYPNVAAGRLRNGIRPARHRPEGYRTDMPRRPTRPYEEESRVIAL
ncbi:hypothetical protein [Streptomyces sp. NPDC002553]|uniref:hypothetical protein n=1 Tax=Streptomyces sp. NPDC002553 TaxID=3154417 RepID=UPI0033349094